MKILIIGYYYSMNLGDAVICDCMAARLRKEFPDAEVVIRDIWGRETFTPSPDTTMAMIRKQQLRFRIRSFCTLHTTHDKQLEHEQYVLRQNGTAMRRVAEESCDLVVFAGGQLLTDFLSHELCFYIRHFSARNIPVLLNALGTGPCYSQSLEKELRKALNNPTVKYFSVRDHVDEVNHKYFNCNRASYAADPGLWADDVYTSEKNDSSDTIGLGIMLPYNISVTRMTIFWIRLIRALDRNGIHWQAFTNGESSDTVFARYVLSHVRSSEDCLHRAPQKPKELVREIAGYRGIISMRLHSHIIAASLGIPSCAIVWDDKLPEFFRHLGYPERCLSISASPARIIETYLKAEKEGVKRDYIRKTRKESEQKLMHAVHSLLNS